MNLVNEDVVKREHCQSSWQPAVVTRTVKAASCFGTSVCPQSPTIPTLKKRTREPANSILRINQPATFRHDAINLTYRRNSTGRRSRCLRLPSVRTPRSHNRRRNPETNHFAAGVRQNVAELLEYSNETKKRNFLETVEYVLPRMTEIKPNFKHINTNNCDKGSKLA